MNKRTWKAIMILIGAYLIYSGASILYAATNGDVSAQTIFIVCGGIFTVFGAVTVWFNLRDLFRMIKGAKKSMEAEWSEELPDEGSEDIFEEDVDLEEDEADETDEADEADEADEEDEEDGEDEGVSAAIAALSSALEDDNSQ